MQFTRELRAEYETNLQDEGFTKTEVNTIIGRTLFQLSGGNAGRTIDSLISVQKDKVLLRRAEKSK